MYSRYIIILVLFDLIENISGYQVKDGPLLTKRPPWLKVCRRSDPELNKCINDLFQQIFPELAKGIPEINVDPFEPLTLDKVSVSKGSGAITLTGSLFDLIVAGPSNATTAYTQFDIEKRKWNFAIDIPLLKIKSQYNLKGKILVLPLVGHGGCNLRLTKVQTKVATHIKFVTRDGHEIVEIDKMNVTFSVGGLKIKLQNLFNGNRILGQTVNAFINQNALEIVTELQESIGESLAGIFMDILNNIYVKLPTDLWLLTDEQYEQYQKEQSTVAKN